MNIGKILSILGLVFLVSSCGKEYPIQFEIRFKNSTSNAVVFTEIISYPYNSTSPFLGLIDFSLGQNEVSPYYQCSLIKTDGPLLPGFDPVASMISLKYEYLGKSCQILIFPYDLNAGFKYTFRIIRPLETEPSEGHWILETNQ